MKRSVCLIIICLLLSLLLVACSDKNSGDGLDKFEQLLQSSKESDETAETNELFAKKVYIIIPQKASGALSLKTAELADKIYARTGVEAIVKYDNEDIVSYGGILEILIGDTNRLISQEALKPLRVEDYVCKWDRGRIVIGGRNDASTLTAVDQFVEKVLCSATGASLMGENVKLEHKLTYDVSTITLNGYDLYDFVFVYADESTKEKLEVLRDHIARKSGYLLDIVDAKELDETSGKNISLLCVPDMEGASIELLDGNVVICGRDAYALSAAVAEFSSRLFSQNGTHLSLSVESKLLFPYRERALKVCSAFTRELGRIDLSYLVEILQLVRYDDNDLVTVAGISTEVEEYIKANLEDGYSYMSLDVVGWEKIAVISKSEICNDIRSEMNDGYVSISFSVNGEIERRSLVISFDGSVLENERENDILVFHCEPEQGTWLDSYTCIAEDSASFDGSQIHSSVYASDAYKIADTQKDVTVNSDDFCMVFSFRASVKNCNSYDSLKNTAQ